MSDVIRLKDTQRTITGLNKKVLRILNAEHSKYMVGVRRELVGIIRGELDEGLEKGTGFENTAGIKRAFKKLKSETSERGRAGIYARSTKSSITIEFWANEKSEAEYAPTHKPIGFNQYHAIMNALYGRKPIEVENGGLLALGKHVGSVVRGSGTITGYTEMSAAPRVKAVVLANKNWYDEAVDKMAEKIAAIRR